MARLALFASGCIGLIGLLLAAAGPQRAGATPPRPTTVPTNAATFAPTRVPPTVVPTAVPPTAVPTIEPTPTAAPQPVVATAEALDPPELRAVWVDAFHDGFKTPAQVDELVAWARAANLNALFVQVRRRGDAYYLNSLEPRSDDPDLAPGFDALQYLIDKAHQGPQRLQVHAWLATLPIWSKRDTPPLAPNLSRDRTRPPAASPSGSGQAGRSPRVSGTRQSDEQTSPTDHLHEDRAGRRGAEITQIACDLSLPPSVPLTANRRWSGHRDQVRSWHYTFCSPSTGNARGR